MKQTVNLFLAIPQEKTGTLPVRRFVPILGVFLIILLGVWLYGLWQVKVLHKQLDDLSQKVIAVSGTMAQLSNKTATPTTSEAQLASLLKEVASETQLFASIKQEKQRADYGFSPYLLALGQKTLPGVWLTKIIITNQGRDISLSGETDNNANVLVFMASLKKTKAFKNRHIKLVSLGGGAQVQSQPVTKAPTLKVLNHFEVTANGE